MKPIAELKILHKNTSNWGFPRKISRDAHDYLVLVQEFKIWPMFWSWKLWHLYTWLFKQKFLSQIIQVTKTRIDSLRYNGSLVEGTHKVYDGPGPDRKSVYHLVSPKTYTYRQCEILSHCMQFRNQDGDREVQDRLTFNQYIVATYLIPHAGNSSFSTKLSNFSLLVTHKATRAPSAWASCLIGRDKKYRFGKVGYLKQGTKKHGSWTFRYKKYLSTGILQVDNELWFLMSACIFPRWINNYKIEAFFRSSCIYDINKI